MGHHTQRVEGLLTEDYYRAYRGYPSTCHKLLPAAVDIIFREVKELWSRGVKTLLLKDEEQLGITSKQDIRLNY